MKKNIYKSGKIYKTSKIMKKEKFLFFFFLTFVSVFEYLYICLDIIVDVKGHVAQSCDVISDWSRF